MAGFPKVPLVRGDTDDDASIHLHSHVGPARPIPRRDYNRQIIEILNRKPHDSSEAEELEYEDINREFRKFAESNRHTWSDDDSGEETQVEEPPAPKKKVKPVPEKQKALISLWDPKVLGFLIGFVVLLLTSSFPNSTTKTVPVPHDLAGVNSRIDQVDRRVLALDDIARALGQQVDLRDTKQEAFISGLTEKFEFVGHKLETLEKLVASGKTHLDSLREEVDGYKEKLDNMELISADPDALEAKLGEVADKLTRLSQINTDVESMKEAIIQSLVERLPEHVPVYMKGRKIHYLPEFHKFLYSFVENYSGQRNATAPDWETFVAKNEASLKDYIRSLLKNPNYKFLSKDEFEKSLNEKISKNNAVLYSRLNKLIDNLDLSTNVTKYNLALSTNKVVLDNLLDVISKGSIKVNYADYKLGSRILGFLTSTGRDSYQQKSLSRKLFLGWYDYLRSNGLQAPKNLKYNANNVLLDGGEFWQCEASRCAFGVRMSSPIILTDLILKNPMEMRPDDLTLPTSISLYIKPKNKKDAPVLESYLGKFRPEFLRAQNENKYLTKFYKIQELVLEAPGIVDHIKLPVSIINLRIPVRDIYVELRSRAGTTGLYNVKAYGLSEFNSLKYAEEFESILDKLDTEDDSRSEVFYDAADYDSRALGDDDYVL